MGRTPWSAADALVGLPQWRTRLILRMKSGTRASRADQGVRPTNSAAFHPFSQLSLFLRLLCAYLCALCVSALKTHSRVTRASRRGVTLVEMVVVVAIIALIVGLSLPAASAGLDSVRMVSATDSVAAFLNAAVTRAERRQQPIELVVFPQEGRLALYSNEPGFTRELTMPDGVSIEAVLPAQENADPATPRRVLFIPGAPVPGISIQLGNRRHAHRTVHLDPMTGFPRVESVVTP